MARFILYGTPACHLCEVAEQMLAQEARHSFPGGFDQVDISADDQLFERYGIRIPVLRHPDGRELDWPFDVLELRAFLYS